MKRTTTLAGLALTAALALTGCGGTETGSGSGTETPAPASSPAATSSAPAPEGSASAPGSASGAEAISAEHNDADVMFAQMMIPHHQQAVEMSEMLLAKQDIPAEVGDFAQRVIDAQGPEIEHMNSMLGAWGAGPASEDEMDDMDHGSGDDAGMSGMMSEEDMAALEQAEGTEAARLYLEQMTVHHEGAVEMAREQVDAGQNPQAVDLAQQVIEAQEAEIEEMRTMRDAL
jgi:uncharacterized protein (DUF305 family)